ncbi:MAG TPA: hypothetical protein VNH12_08000, partial [Burkholderiales bacterium]|nr:hypothetical protein [Burkholderiales bacterium]
RSAAAALLAAVLAACGSTSPYRYEGEKNLEVRPDLSRARASLHIHRIDAQCRTQYEGSLALDGPVELALPSGRSSLLIVGFDTSSFFGGARSTARRYVLNPRSGYRYRLDVRYKDDIYDVSAVEIPPRGKPSVLELGDCR